MGPSEYWLLVVHLTPGRQQGIIRDILEELGEVAEGVVTARSTRELAHTLGVEMPITEQVHALLYEGKPAQQALMDLMGRRRKQELAGIDQA